MSGSFRNSRPPESWPAGQDYWIYLPVNRSGLLPPIRSLNPRARTSPWMLVEERFMGGHDHGYASFPPPATPHPSVPLLLFEDLYPGPQRAALDSPPAHYHQPWNSRSSAEESKLSPEEQKQAVNKLRRQLYSPHIYNIIRRLGNKSVGAGASNDDEGKRCAVCLEDFETKQFVTITPCNHMFHEDCIVPWVKSQGKCPVCRFVIVERSPARGGASGASAAVASRRGRAERSSIY